MNCQITNLNKLIEYNSYINNLSQLKIKRIWDLKKNVKSFSKKIITYPSNTKKNIHYNNNITLKKNDIVKVKSKKEIKSLLNIYDKTGGCVFAPEMYKFCDKTHVVYKVVNQFYDEVKERMCKCKNMVLLKGALCSGKRKAFPDDCDRNCFFFWHTSWLIKIQ